MLDKLSRCIALSICCALLACSCALAEEGLWMFDEIKQLPLDAMKARGLELSPKEIADLQEAVVLIGGGTGAFVSRDGLILTNHHVAYGAIQHESTLEENFIQNGFLAKTRQEELPAPEYEVFITIGSQDVTDRVLGAVHDDMSFFERHQAIENAQKEIIAEAEEKGDVRCSVVEVLSGSKYYLYTYHRIQDVRLVYAPPSSIGEFGGEIDNWMWPRHTGDFSFMRAYVAPDGSFAEYSEANVPYKPKVYLPISTRGYDEGTYSMIMGYPGATYRYRSSYSLELREKVNYPSFIETAQAQIAILRKAGEEDPELAIRFADRIKSLENGLKNSQGMLEGMKKTKLLQRKLDNEAAFTAFLKANPDMEAKYGDVLPGIAQVYDELYTYNAKQDMLGNVIYSSDLMGQAYTLAEWSIEKSKPDMEREQRYQERNVPNIRESIEIAQNDLHVPTDKKIAGMFFIKAAGLTQGQRIEALEPVIGGKTEADLEHAVQLFIENLYNNTRVHLLDERLKMFNMTEEELKNQGDALIDFTFQLYKENKELEDKFDAFVGAVYQLRPRLIRGMYEWKKSSLYADANRTLRFTYGTVQGYSPADAVQYRYATTIEGVLEKDTGEEPFDVPERLKELAGKRDYGRYADPKLKTMVVDFLTNHDTTGGSSGSPVLNGRGEIIGVTFDGNYESMTSDYQYDPELTRCINVDARYVLFITEKFNEAKNVLRELDIR